MSMASSDKWGGFRVNVSIPFLFVTTYTERSMMNRIVSVSVLANTIESESMYDYNSKLNQLHTTY